MDMPLEEEIGVLLSRLGLRLALAESCTGGLLGHYITNVPGSSAYFMGGITAYANEVKASLLGVKWETLNTYGAVSREAALEMARGARRVLDVDVAISITGIAGPGDGTLEKPVGLTWIGLSTEDQESAQDYILEGSRLQVKEQSAEMALRLLRDYLRSRSDGSC
jgi:PncC family amidohydrolase